MTVSEAVKLSGTSALFAKGAVKAAQNMLYPTEPLLWAQVSNVYTCPVRGELSTQALTKDMLAGVIMVTDQRILFVHNVLGRGITKEIHMSNIQSIDSKDGSINSCLRIKGVTDMIVTTCNRKVAQQLRTIIEEALANWKVHTSAAAAPAATAATVVDTAQLQALKQLYDAGVLTEEEFSAKKAQLLGL